MMNIFTDVELDHIHQSVIYKLKGLMDNIEFWTDADRTEYVMLSALGAKIEALKMINNTPLNIKQKMNRIPLMNTVQEDIPKNISMINTNNTTNVVQDDINDNTENNITETIIMKPKK